MFRHALRSLGKCPAYSLTSILTLGLGIGLTTAAFSLLNGFVLRPLPFADPESLVDVHETSATRLCAGCAVGTSFPIYDEWRRHARSFVSLEAITERPFSIAGHDRPADRVSGALVSAGMFPMLGVAPIYGRSFTLEEDRAGGAPVALVSEEIWQDRLGSASLEKLTLRVNGVEHVVVGVMPRGFGFPEFARVWLPLRSQATDWALDDRSLEVVGRLAPGRSVPAARDEMAALARGLAERFPPTHREWSASVTPLREDIVGEEARLAWMLVAMVFVVLLIACVNLAGIGLARATAREREMAVRIATGARARDLAGLLLIESLCLAAAGGMLGLLLALWTVDLARALLPQQIPFWLRFDIDWRVATFCAAVTITAGIAAGLLPAWRAARPDVLPALKQGVGTTSDAQGVRRWLVGAELALALVLVVSAGLITKTFVRAISSDPGYETSRLLTADVGLFGGKYQEPAAVDAFARAWEQRMATIGATERTAVSRVEFVASFGAADRMMEVEGADVSAGASPRFAYVVSPGYFATLGLQVRRGRTFTEADDERSEPVAIVNDALASRVWPGTSALGRRLRLPGGAGQNAWRTVIGIVANVGGSPLAARRDAPSYVYLPFAQSPGRPLTLHMRSRTTPYALAPVAVDAVRAIDGDEPVENIQSAEDALATWALPAKVSAVMVSSLAFVALLLAAIGLYGVVAYSVGRRTREFGIRMALGATARDVFQLVVRQGLRVTVSALAAGLLIAAGVTQALRVVLFGSDPRDPMVFAASAVILAIVTGIATAVPAARAARVQPQVALRWE